MTFKLTAFRGEFDQLVKFINDSWKKLYASRGPCLLWSRELFEWHLRQKQKRGDWEKSVVAYQGDELVGCALGFPFVLAVGDKKFGANWLSWVTVSPAMQSAGHHLSFELLDAYVKRTRQGGLNLIFGISQASQTSRYWRVYFRFYAKRYRQYFATDTLGDGTYCLCVLDLARFEKWSGGFSGEKDENALAESSDENTPAACTIQPPDDSEILMCRSIYNEQNSTGGIYRIWEEKAWRTQLAVSSFVKTLVLKVGGRVEGFINYYFCEMRGGGKYLPVACVAHFCVRQNCRPELAAALLRVADQRMRQEGAAAAILPRLNYFPKLDYESLGYYPMPEIFKLFYGSFEPAFQPMPRSAWPALKPAWAAAGPASPAGVSSLPFDGV
jgi:hypothetical protein